jgi:DNA-binding XRE family transcriptional regulator
MKSTATAVDWEMMPAAFREIGREFAAECRAIATEAPTGEIKPFKRSLKEMRKDKHLSVRDLAELVGCHKTVIGKIELGNIEHSRFEAKIRAALAP